MFYLAASLLLAGNYIAFFADAEPMVAAFFKVLPIVILILWACRQAANRPLLIAALCLGGCGDVILALGYFIPGLVAFLIGHCLYITLWLSSPTKMRWAIALPMLVLLAISVWLIVPGSGDLQIPVAAYLLVIFVMAILACRSTLVNNWGLLGVYSFLVSDFILAWHQFIAPLGYSVLAIMVTYYLAQSLITLSVIQTTTTTTTTKTTTKTTIKQSYL
ncbi:lysoplasmalogenase [Oceanicoccus sagamiensis]|uniref:Lysoplasmalogenase n=1 Tax=Oceanicoccus sagamiensis TaxID=716816 RepID=A0A1X9NEN6_9GAMM|nr:lysoplasmalogenase [Oceanicoccus sagamiensis]ARN76006.1 hypothetical protein BST96_19045 [Oceanicoccus sagamiensis]